MYMTETEFMAFEEKSDIRYEYLQGEVVAMAGASRNHIELTNTLTFLLYSHLRGKECRAYSGDTKTSILTSMRVTTSR